MNSSDCEKLLDHLGYVPYRRYEDALVGVRYKATRKDDASDLVFFDIVDTGAAPEAKLLCDNLESAARVSQNAGIVHIRDTIYLKELFIAISTAVREYEPPRQHAINDEFWIALAKLVQAIRLLHRREYVHCAISPLTVYWSESGPWLGEFWWMHNAEGLPVSGAPSDEVTRQIPTAVLPYLSPEQLEGEVPTRESDLYALGAYIYHMVTGKAPRNISRSMLEAAPHKVLSTVPIMPVEEWRPDVSNDVRALINGLLVRNPDDRLNIFMLEAMLAEKTGTIVQTT